VKGDALEMNAKEHLIKSLSLRHVKRFKFDFASVTYFLTRRTTKRSHRPLLLIKPTTKFFSLTASAPG